MTSEEVTAEIIGQRWTSYSAQPWTGDDPETHGDSLLRIWKPQGIGAYAHERAEFVTPELADYIVRLHNLAVGYGGIDTLEEYAWRYEELLD